MSLFAEVIRVGVLGGVVVLVTPANGFDDNGHEGERHGG